MYSYTGSEGRATNVSGIAPRMKYRCQAYIDGPNIPVIYAASHGVNLLTVVGRHGWSTYRVLLTVYL